MEFKIENIPISMARKSTYIAAIIDSLKKLNSDGSNSFFASCNTYRNPNHLRNTLCPMMTKENIRISASSEYKFECGKHLSYILNRKSPLCSECKLIDQGLRIWRVDKLKDGVRVKK